MENWKTIWEKRSADFSKVDIDDSYAIFKELKRIDGFDVVGELSIESLLAQHREIVERLSKYNTIKSIFEVGCGCGANLYLFNEDNYKIGGVDYSTALINIANQVFHNKVDMELICSEASAFPVDKKYDAAFSNSVFSYFPDEEYARAVLDRISQKARYSFGLIDVHNIDKKNDFYDFRRATIPDYDKRYNGLDKLFYSKEFFAEWGRQNGFDIEFYDSKMDGYWNSKYVFDVYGYRK